MSNLKDFEYLEASEFIYPTIIVLKDVKSFVRFANANEIKYIFKIAHDENKIEFFFPHQGTVYKIDGKGFNTLADMQTSQSRGFPTATEFYQSEKAGFGSYQEFVDLSQTGIENKEEYQIAHKSGFVSGFDKFKSKYESYKSNPHQSVMPSDLDNPVKLNLYAISKGIDSYHEFEKIYDAGFLDKLTYNDAVSKGFQNSTEYYEAIKKGFGEKKEHMEAQTLHIESKKEFEDYIHLKTMNEHRNYYFDELQLLVAISNCENGSVLPISEVKKLLSDSQEKLKKTMGDSDQKILPIWYKRNLDTEANLLKFLKGNEELKMYGFFNTGKNAFEIFKASAIKIFVDGSNVAHNDKGSKVKPEIKYIRLLVKALKSWKFTNVTVISDASLKHKVKDYNLVNELKKECDYYEAPAKTSADEFLIASVKKEKCLVVTNDQFNEWRRKDKWVKDKFDSIRVPFLINKDDKVILKGMDQHREKTIDE